VLRGRFEVVRTLVRTERPVENDRDQDTPKESPRDAYLSNITGFISENEQNTTTPWRATIILRFKVLVPHLHHQ
jgi:hypothetical protein